MDSSGVKTENFGGGDLLPNLGPLSGSDAFDGMDNLTSKNQTDFSSSSNPLNPSTHPMNHSSPGGQPGGQSGHDDFNSIIGSISDIGEGKPGPDFSQSNSLPSNLLPPTHTLPNNPDLGSNPSPTYLNSHPPGAAVSQSLEVKQESPKTQQSTENNEVNSQTPNPSENPNEKLPKEEGVKEEPWRKTFFVFFSLTPQTTF